MTKSELKSLNTLEVYPVLIDTCFLQYNCKLSDDFDEDCMQLLLHLVTRAVYKYYRTEHKSGYDAFAKIEPVDGENKFVFKIKLSCPKYRIEQSQKTAIDMLNNFRSLILNSDGFEASILAAAYKDGLDEIDSNMLKQPHTLRDKFEKQFKGWESINAVIYFGVIGGSKNTPTLKKSLKI